MSDALTTIATTLAKQGAPVLGGLIGTAIGGPVGAAVGGLAGKALETLAEALGTEAEPEAIAEAIERPGAAQAIQRAEAGAPELIRLFEIEARRVSDAQAAEISQGFTAWQFWRNFIQAVVWGGWTVLLVSAVFGGNIGIKGNMPLADIVTAWGSVSLLWMVVFHGGHTAKDVFSVSKWGRK
ncbi:MAG: hypothetical protein J0L51_00105 [Rhizobiales bacterium]|nr:hypothetical protein [Hyphomicrobiales bacterium]